MLLRTHQPRVERLVRIPLFSSCARDQRTRLELAQAPKSATAGLSAPQMPPRRAGAPYDRRATSDAEQAVWTLRSDVKKTRAHRRAGLVALVALAVLSGCSGGSSTKQSADGSTTPRSPAQSSETSTTTTRPAESPLEAVALSNRDLSAGSTLRLVPGGAQVAGQVTLDQCNANFPSEAARTARLQLEATSNRRLLVGDENVTYRSPAAAAQAMQEVRRAVKNCPTDTFRPSKVPGQLPFKFKYQAIPDRELGEVARDHVAVFASASDPAGSNYEITGVLQRRGDVLVSIYGSDVATIAPFVHLTASRLAALNPRQAGQ